ncbi:MAG: hypothetical protein L6Q59_16605 [Ignavibacteriaceae bacterium]|nr:hypothetical protein [Ignavibacteriaceae bacterium]
MKRGSAKKEVKNGSAETADKLKQIKSGRKRPDKETHNRKHNADLANEEKDKQG